jgi:hypothetical protein
VTTSEKKDKIYTQLNIFIFLDRTTKKNEHNLTKDKNEQLNYEE